VAIIEKRKTAKKVIRSYRLREGLIKKIDSIALSMGESRTYVLESLLEYGIKAYEKEKKERREKIDSGR